jgi:tripartite-type tricarboxylate transporter receptor subunit TctC
MAPPGVPAERVKELRDALDATVADPAFVADIEKRNLHLDPVGGEEMTKTLVRAFSFPPDVIAAARETLGGR